MSSFVWPAQGGGSSAGVSSLNTETGDITIAAGTGVTVISAGQTITISATGGGSGVTSINADTTPAQLLTVGTTGTDFAIANPGSGSHVFNLPTASATNRGALASADWTTFNAKQGPLTIGNLTSTPTTNLVVTGGAGSVIGSGVTLTLTGASIVEATSAVLTITGATNAVLGTGVTIQVKQATTAQSGYLSSTDWNTFNGKGAGTVTSVAMTVPAFLSITGSPVTTTGTLAVGLSGTALPIANGGTAVTAVTVAPAATAFAGWDANKNLSANNHLEGYATTATAAGTTVLVVGSAYQQFFTGTTTQLVTLPVASTLVLGQSFVVTNNSTGVVTVQSSGANAILAQSASSTAIYTCILISGTTAASWSVSSSTSASNLTGTVLPVNGGTGNTTGGMIGTNWTAYTPTLVGVGTATGVSCFWGRRGDSVLLKINFTTGTPTATTATVSLPSGLTFDTTKLNTSAANLVGYSVGGSSSAAQIVLVAGTVNGTTLNFGNQSGSTNGLSAGAGSGLFGSSQTVSFYSTEIPIVGWNWNS